MVVAGRGMTYEQVDEIAQGRVWSGKDALVNGLADEKGILLDAIEAAASEAGLSKYKIVTYPQQKSFMKSMREDSRKDLPLVRTVMEPGFKAMTLMPFVTFDPEFVL